LKHFDVDGYQDALRRQKRKNPDAQLRSNYQRHKRNVAAQAAAPKKKYYEDDEQQDWRQNFERTH
jgi:hypothetical protein